MTTDSPANTSTRRVWPAVAVTCGLGLSAIWAAVLFYSLFSLVLERLLGPLASHIVAAIFS